MPKHGKNYNAAAAKVEAGKVYSPKEAMTLAKESPPLSSTRPSRSPFAPGVDTQNDQNIRGSISLPNGTGKTVRVAVLPRAPRLPRPRLPAPTSSLRRPHRGGPEGQHQLRRRHRHAQPHGQVSRLRPYPRPAASCLTPAGYRDHGCREDGQELKAGRVEYRADRYGICHVPMGKASFDVKALVENYGALLTELLRVKPSSAKGKYVKSIVISTTMGLASRSTPPRPATSWRTSSSCIVVRKPRSPEQGYFYKTRGLSFVSSHAIPGAYVSMACLAWAS